jgi:TRAP-type C4-dicarboxylate transport system permease small subunit
MTAANSSARSAPETGAEASSSKAHTISSADEIVASFAEADHQTVSLKSYTFEDWLSLIFFWLMTGLVCLQFITRYILNDSVSWTEELAVYCLIVVVFIGSAACVRRSRHIQVNFLYRYLPKPLGKLCSALVDIVQIAFFCYVAWLFSRYALAVNNEPMTTIQWNKSHVYWLAFAGMFLMALRSIQTTYLHWRQGYSALTRPEAYD